ncbi:hypothetical protein [Falsiroseomonas oryziterrae]|uniref:hypothetical protein n=1 Tax=Falsiroseomonas oryziterrae TaxID=2911368 RepID=UPI001F41742D|nr:hypothetical protein [Roseomonas sp. NPKOSM-4]
MAIFWVIPEGEGVRVDGTDIWLVAKIHADGSADLTTPDGRTVTLQPEIAFRVGPGFRMWLMPGAPAGTVRLAMESYVPLMHRHPPRSHRPGAARRPA